MKLTKNEAEILAKLIKVELHNKIHEFNEKLINEAREEFLSSEEVIDFVIFIDKNSNKSLLDIQNFLFNNFKRSEIRLMSHSYDIYNTLKDEIIIAALESDSTPLYELQTLFVRDYWGKIKKKFDDNRPK